MSGRRLPAEWEPQAFVQLTWPHAQTDWKDLLPEVLTCYQQMATEILRHEPLLIVAAEDEDPLAFAPGSFPYPYSVVHCPTNDTWARDHAFISVFTSCLLAPNRNEPMESQEIEQKLKEYLGAERVLWLHHGHLAGDDTDGHIDTLARLCPDNTIAYVRCEDKNDEHYEDLSLMEAELSSFSAREGNPYRFVPLPMPSPIFDEEGQRLPATYANFLIVNGAVLYPTYRQPQLDAQAARQLQQAFPHHSIIGIDCLVLIQQHGSLHCSAMQYPLI